MPTADDALNVARSRLGAGPDEFYAWYPAGPGTAWCCIFQSWVQTQIGLPTHYAWVSGLFDAMRAEGRTLAPWAAQPGDLVAFDYDGGGPTNYDHIALVEHVDLDAGYMVCVDGNWQNRVQRVRRSFGASGYAGGIAEVCRPFYDVAPIPTPPAPTPIPQGAEMVRFIRPQSSPKVFLVDAEFVGGAIHARDEQALKDLNWALSNTPGVSIAAPPAGAQVDTVAGVPVWVVSDAFATTIGIA